MAEQVAMELGLAPFRAAAGLQEGRLIDLWRSPPEDLPGACRKLVGVYDESFQGFARWQIGISEASEFVSNVVTDLLTRSTGPGLSARNTRAIQHSWRDVVERVIQAFFHVADTHVEQRQQAIDLYIPMMDGRCRLAPAALDSLLDSAQLWERGVADLLLLPQRVAAGSFEFLEVRVAQVYATGQGSHSQRIYTFIPEGARALDACEEVMVSLNAAAPEVAEHIWKVNSLEAPQVRPFLRLALRPNSSLEIWIGNQTILEHFEGQWRLTLPGAQVQLLSDYVNAGRELVERDGVGLLVDLARSLATHNHGAIIALVSKDYKTAAKQRQLSRLVERLPERLRTSIDEQTAAKRTFGAKRYIPFRGDPGLGLGRLVYSLFVVDGACIVSQLEDQMYLREFGQVIQTDTKITGERPGSRRLAARTLSKDAHFVICISQDGPVRVFVKGKEWGRIR